MEDWKVAVHQALTLVPFIENAQQHTLFARIKSVIKDRGKTKKIIDNVSDEMS